MGRTTEENITGRTIGPDGHQDFQGIIFFRPRHAGGQFHVLVPEGWSPEEIEQAITELDECSDDKDTSFHAVKCELVDEFAAETREFYASYEDNPDSI